MIFILLIFSFLFSEESRILRYPNASDSQITFTHAGDVYVVSKNGGMATRLTSDKGIEMFPRFSNDGKYIAFSAEYDGNREIYIIPSTGGTPKRITYSVDMGSLPDRMGPDKIIMHWSKDNKSVVYRSRHNSWQAWTGKLFKQSIDGGLPEEIQVPVSGFAYLSPDESKLAYNRVFREFRTWKRYRGGQADDIWIYDFKTKKLDNITNDNSQDIIPMWAGNKVYYCSDRTGTMNLFSYDFASKATKQVTNYDNYDVKFPSLNGETISYENEGFVYLLDTKTDNINKVSIQIAGDFPDSRPEIKDLSKNITNASLSPKSERVAVLARGDIFTAPTENGNIHTLINSSSSHEREITWSPDGKWIAYISDKSGEDEVYITRPDGSETTQLTNDAQSYRYNLKWSPDSKKLLNSDKAMRLYYIDIATKKTTEIRKSTHFEINDFNWSPDSKWVVFTDLINNYWPIVYLYNLDNKQTTQVTDEFFQSGQAVFTPGGNYLLFVSDRTFNANIGNFEWNFSYSNLSKIYGVTLRNDVKTPFEFKDDLVDWKETATKGDSKKDDKADSSKPIIIDLDGIKNRIFEFPVPASNYGNLTPTKDHKLYYTKSSSNGSDAGTYVFDIEKKEEKKIGDFTAWEISVDQKKILVLDKGNLFLENISPKVDLQNKINLNNLKANVNHKEEWTQVFNEAWRQMKHFFYDPNMHGNDWNAIKLKYQALLPYVNHKYDLNYLLGEMIGELNVGHAYVGGGEMPTVAKVGIGLLGADIAWDGSGYKITKIYEGRNWEANKRSPLTEPGFDIKEGQYIISIDGIKLDKNSTPFMALVDKVNKNVKLEISSSANGANSKIYYPKTLSSEADLRYLNWVEGNRKYVDKVSGGKLAYVHIPDMGVGNGLNEFVKYFYPQARKSGMIIDDRYNGGGNVSPMIIERLKREVTLVQNLRNQQAMTGKPDGTMTGPLVCLINELSASDGDLFPYQFKQSNLGPLIGKRTWGGVIGIRGSLPFIDGTYMMRPEFSHFSTDGKWVLEGTGQSPDIEVDNLPVDVLNGKDAQLDKAIEVINELIKTDKKNKFPDKVPPYDDRSKKKK